MLKLKRFDEGVWYEWPKNPQIKLKIRALTPKKLLDLREGAKRGKIAVTMPNGEAQIVDDISESRLNWECFNWMLEAWEGIEFDGDPPEKSKDDAIKETIFDHASLRDFISEKAAEVFVKESSRIETELKNSMRSQSGSPRSATQASGATSAGPPTKS